MSPLPTNVPMRDFSHRHQFHPVTNDTPYLCDDCKVPGNGSRFCCTICQHDSHYFCTEGPDTLTSSMTTHPHPFIRVVHEPQPNQTMSCRSCDYPVEGLAYKCNDCNVFVHPDCAYYWLRETHDRAYPSNSDPAAQSLPELIGTVAGKAIVYYAKKWWLGASDAAENNPPTGS